MPDKVKKTELAHQESRVVSKPSALGLGERLRSARKARALSLEHVSETLHLDETIILALEDERFDVLGAPVFVRGHLKAYARLVGLSPESVLEAFHETDQLPEVLPTPGRETNHSVTVNPVLWGFWAVVILLAFGLGVYLLLGDDGRPPEPAPVASPVERESDLSLGEPISGKVSPDESAPIEEEIREQVVTMPVSNNTSEPEPESDDFVAAPQAEIEQSAEVMSAPVPVLTDEPMRLSLHFHEESWVEISDADRRLLFGLQRKGRRRELTGEPPFELLLGNANGIEVLLNDRPYSIPVTAISGKVARFSITRAEIE
jgi:cytoskeleton protein RodZ